MFHKRQNTASGRDLTLDRTEILNFIHHIGFVEQRVCGPHFVQALSRTIVGNTASQAVEIWMFICATGGLRGRFGLIWIALFVCNTVGVEWGKNFIIKSTFFSHSTSLLHSPQFVEIPPSVIQVTTRAALLVSHARQQLLWRQIDGRLGPNAQTIWRDRNCWDSPRRSNWDGREIDDWWIDIRCCCSFGPSINFSYPHQPWSRIAEISPLHSMSELNCLGKSSMPLEILVMRLTGSRGSNVPRRYWMPSLSFRP